MFTGIEFTVNHTEKKARCNGGIYENWYLLNIFSINLAAFKNIVIIGQGFICIYPLHFKMQVQKHRAISLLGASMK